HRLDAAYRRPVSLEDIGSFSEVANDVHHAHPASNQEGVERALGRVPRHLPAHEVAVPGALFVRALAKRGVGDVARMNIGQLADLRCNPGAPLALLRRRVAGLPHEVVAMSIRRPSNTSNTVTAPRSPMSDVAPSTSTIGSRRRAAAMASPSLVWAFSRTRNASSSAWKVLRSTILGAPSSSLMMSFIVLSLAAQALGPL